MRTLRIKKISFGNLIMLSSFAAVFSIVTAVCAGTDRKSIELSSTAFSSKDIIDSMATSIETAATDAVSIVDTLDVATVSVSSQEATSELQNTVYTVTEYATPITMYTSDTVNVRSGAGTDYDKVGKLKWGTETTVTGETDNGWYEVAFDNGTAFIIGDYMVNELPGTPIVFVGDSRTVQLENAVGTTDKAYIAKVGEGYSWFSSTALAEIPHVAGPGTTMIINFGVNDLANASKYISLINNNIDDWLNAGITVYYAAVTPVGSGASVTNAQIEKFNSRMQSELDPRIQWIDGYSFLTKTGFSSSDGLHYSADTYKNLYYYYMSVISQI